MGNSTITLESAYDAIAARGIPDPRLNPSGFGDTLALDCANRIMADYICERFNWKFNRANATPFYTNSWQQDYPQPAQPRGKIGWGEDGDILDINNTCKPLPLWNVTWRRQLSRTSVSVWRPSQVSWMYNQDLSIGEWPGPGVVYSPLVTTAPQSQNPIMSMTDTNGNILIVSALGVPVPTLPLASIEIAGGLCYLACSDTLTIPVISGQTYLLAGMTTVPSLNGVLVTANATVNNALTFPTLLPDQVQSPETGTATPQTAANVTGTTGATAPVLPANSAEGTTVIDGTVVWMCVDPNSQGFRLDKLPNATGPVFKILPYYQIEPPTFSNLAQLLNPIPDSYSRGFTRGLEAECYIASPNPGDKQRGQDAKVAWLNALAGGMKQGDRELNVYALIPLTNVVERRWDEIGPYTADQPY